VVHLRPDDAPAEKRSAAVEAFRRLAGPYVAAGADGAYELPGTARAPDEPPQFCLVRVLSDPEHGPRAVVAVISRCADGDEAEARLEEMRRQLG
jgi:hypothetical protein